MCVTPTAPTLNAADHLGVVHALARKATRSGAEVGLDLDELVSIGSLALVKACRSFDPARGLAPTTFLYPWVRGAIGNAIRDARRRRPLRLITEDEDEAKAIPDPLPSRESRRRELAEVAARLVDTLPPRLRRVVSLRFGLGGRGGQTLRQIGRRLRITRERVRQLLTAALKRLRWAAEEQSLTAEVVLG